MVTINLFDYNFRQAECSTAHQRSEEVRWLRGVRGWGGLTVFTDAYVYDPVVDEVQSRYKFAWLREPMCLWPKHYENIGQVLHKFDRVLTYNVGLVTAKADSKFAWVPYGGVWVPRGEWKAHRKAKMLSMLYGSKQATPGHKFRHEVARMVDKEYHYCDFYGHTGTPTSYGSGTKLRVLKDYRFSIVIEACREPGLFTEILLDCFALGTVPIFWGAPDVGAWFNAEGILQFRTLDDLDLVLSGLSAGTYEAMLPAVLDNLERVAEYAVAEDWMARNGVFKGFV